MNKETKRKRRENFKYDEKIDIVRMHYFEGASLKELARFYNTEPSVITRIISTFAKEKDTNLMVMGRNTTINKSDEIKTLRKEVLELKKRLYNETMRADFNETMIEVAEEMFGIEIRKKAGSGQSKGCMKGNRNTR
jgi:transposase-like protein